MYDTKENNGENKQSCMVKRKWYYENRDKNLFVDINSKNDIIAKTLSKIYR